MRATTAALIAAVFWSLGFGGAALSAQPGSSASLASGCACESPDRNVLAVQYVAPGQGSAATADDVANVDVASGLANRLNSQSGSSPEVIGTPMSDGPMTDAPLMDAPVCCAPACCCCNCPCWTISAGAIFLNQSGPGHAPVLDGNQNPRTPLLRANQFDPGIRFGYELDAIRHNVGGSCWDVEARYFGINRWTSTLPTIVAPGTGAVIPFLTTPLLIAPGDRVATVYQSILQNVEINGRKNVNPWLQLIAGVRYIAFDDSVGETATPIAGATRFGTVSTHNSLIGPQMGANAFVWQRGRMGLQTFGKAGIYADIASNNIDATSTRGTLYSSSAKGGHTSFVGELGLTGTYRLTNNWGFRSTYEMLWIDGVARAPDQIASSNPITGVGGLTSNSALFYYGAFFGLEYYR